MDPGEQRGPMKHRAIREMAVVALVALLWGTIVLCLVVLDRNDHAWMALLVYACVYVAIAAVQRRSAKK